MKVILASGSPRRRELMEMLERLLYRLLLKVKMLLL